VGSEPSVGSQLAIRAGLGLRQTRAGPRGIPGERDSRDRKLSLYEKHNPQYYAELTVRKAALQIASSRHWSGNRSCWRMYKGAKYGRR
jgi:hypothetical protein